MKRVSEEFVIRLTDNIANYGDWLSVVRFGMAHLLENPQLLVEVIGRRAAHIALHGPKSRVVADEMCTIFNDLGLRVVMADVTVPLTAGAEGGEDATEN